MVLINPACTFFWRRETSVLCKKIMKSLSDFTIHFTTAADGARIGYRRIGKGPGVILVHGALQSSLNFTVLAKALSADFTVYIPDRRGRGLSDRYGDHDDLVTEARDVLALARATDAVNIFGLSSGAIIVLQAVLLEPLVFEKAALYEPPIPGKGHPFVRLGRVYEASMRKGNVGRAFINILQGTGDTSLVSLLPAFITAPFINILMNTRTKSNGENEIPLQVLVALFHHDLIVVNASASLIEKAPTVSSSILLMGGSGSKQFLKTALDLLHALLPDVQRVEFKKLGHVAADNSEQPLIIAGKLGDFFKDKMHL
jgi:pimeloyl-ACP methyl ester carboxylesterase